MCFFSTTMHVHVRLLRRIYRYSAWCTTTALASKNLRSLANWTRMRHDEAGTYYFSRACQNHYRIATRDARSLEHCIAGWHSAPLWPFACENTRLRCRQSWGTLCFEVTVWAPLTVTCMFHLGWICYHIPYSFQYNEHSSWGFCIFSGSIYYTSGHQLSAPSCKRPLPASAVVQTWLEMGKHCGQWRIACTRNYVTY